jgi:hypothetical protein
MIAVDIYRPDQWRDFFLMVGGGAAALTGLVFVAMSLNLYIIFADPTHRSRAVGTLTGFIAAFSICALALMGGQNHVAVGSEWLTVSSAAAYVYVLGYVRAQRSGVSTVGLNRLRLAGGTGCYVVQIVGSILLIAGYIAGLYVAAVAMIVFFAFMISGAWLLLLGVHQDQKRLSLDQAGTRRRDAAGDDHNGSD